MKYFQRFVLVVVLIGLAAGYYVWPQFAIRRFATAVDRKDTETLKRMVDFEELRKSLKKLTVDAMVLALSESGRQVDPATARSKMQEFIESPQGKAQLDQLMNPDALATMLATKQAGDTGPMTWRNEQWTSLWEFCVQDTESSGFLNLKLTANGWKMVGFEIPESDLRDFLKKQGRMPAPAAALRVF